MNFKFHDETSDILQVEDGFEIPVFSYNVDYHATEHSNKRIKKRGAYEPLEFEVPFNLYTKRNSLDRDEVTRAVTELISKGTGYFSLDDSEYMFYGEFTGPFTVPKHINIFTVITLTFKSEYSFKFAKEETVLTGKTVTVPDKLQIPVAPQIELTGASNDVQISISGDDFRKMRLQGNVPSSLYIDIDKEIIQEKNTGINKVNLLLINSSFEDFLLRGGDVVTTNSGTMKITFRELIQ